MHVVEDEDKLAELIMDWCRKLWPLTARKIRKLAYEYAVLNEIEGFSPTRKIAGPKWLKAFMSRYPQLKKKCSRNLAIHRAQCTSEQALRAWFPQYQKWLEEFNITSGDQLWNVDETGLGNMPKEGTQVVGVKAEPAMQVVSGEKPENQTVLTFVSASGIVLKPLAIFKAKKVQQIWRDVAEEKVKLAASSKGYINTNIFCKYGCAFIGELKRHNLLKPGRKHMVLLDGHASHLFNLGFMELMIENGIEVVALPPHTTHLLQPLDDLPFARLKADWQELLLDFNLAVGGRRMTKLEWLEHLLKQFWKSVTPSAVKSAWRNTGLWPADPDVVKLRRAIKGSVSPPKKQACESLTVQFCSVACCIEFL